MTKAIEPTTTAASKRGRRINKTKPKPKKRKIAPPTRTLRTRDGVPLRAKITTRSEESDLVVNVEVFEGYVAIDSVVFEENVVLTDQIDGFPKFELAQSTITKIEYIDPTVKGELVMITTAQREVGGE
jgi:hypothetical protein